MKKTKGKWRKILHHRKTGNLHYFTNFSLLSLACLLARDERETSSHVSVGDLDLLSWDLSLSVTRIRRKKRERRIIIPSRMNE
jgi:hypothetical protein